MPENPSNDDYVTAGERLDRAISKEDWRTAIGIALRARMEADNGNVCMCPTPLHPHHDGLLPYEKGAMCHHCGLEDQAIVDERMAYARAPHPFVPGADKGIKAHMCKVCTELHEVPPQTCGGRGTSDIARRRR